METKLSNSFAYACPGMVDKRTLEGILNKSHTIGKAASGSENTSAFIKAAVHDYFGFSDEQLGRRSRKRELAFARHLSMFLHCRKTNFPLGAIGDIHGSFHHTTVIHSRDKIVEILSQAHESVEKKDVIVFLKTYGFADLIPAGINRKSRTYERNN